MLAPAVCLRGINRRFGPVLANDEDLVRRVTAFGDGGPMEDDLTVVYVHRPA